MDARTSKEHRHKLKTDVTDSVLLLALLSAPSRVLDDRATIEGYNAARSDTVYGNQANIESEALDTNSEDCHESCPSSIACTTNNLGTAAREFDPVTI